MSTSELLNAWTAAEPFVPILPSSLHPYLALVTLVAGSMLATKFGIADKPVLAHDILTSVPASALLGFGVVFLFLSCGLYV